MKRDARTAIHFNSLPLRRGGRWALRWRVQPQVAWYLITLCEVLFARLSPLGNNSRLQYEVPPNSESVVQVAPVRRRASCIFWASPACRSSVVADC